MALPEALWAVWAPSPSSASPYVPWREALRAVGNGTDVYLFLTGMMLLAELARQRAVFDWLAARAVKLAKGSASRLFALVFVIATLVTALLSNDATAVVLTPAVFAAAKAARAKPLPYLFICAFVANAASFVLPISNPANLVVFGRYMPTLPSWLAQFALPSAVAVLATFVVLRLAQRAPLREAIAVDIPLPVLTPSGRWTVLGIALSAAVLLTASTFDFRLGLPTFLAAIVTAGAVLLKVTRIPLAIAQTYFLERLALGRGALCSGRGADSHRGHTAIERPLDGGCRRIGRPNQLGGRADHRGCLQPHQQPTRRVDCALSACGRADCARFGRSFASDRR